MSELIFSMEMRRMQSLSEEMAAFRTSLSPSFRNRVKV